jgi:hypothetical protein
VALECGTAKHPMADLDGVVDAIDEVKDAVASRPVESRSTLLHGFGTVMVAILIFIGVRALVGDLWNNKTMIALRYGVSADAVTIQKRPNACDFLRAPIGTKGCGYERVFFTIQTRTNANGQSLVSYDEAKTWSLNESQEKPGVTVAWKETE